MCVERESTRARERTGESARARERERERERETSGWRGLASTRQTMPASSTSRRHASSTPPRRASGASPDVHTRTHTRTRIHTNTHTHTHTHTQTHTGLSCLPCSPTILLHIQSIHPAARTDAQIHRHADAQTLRRTSTKQAQPLTRTATACINRRGTREQEHGGVLRDISALHVLHQPCHQRLRVDNVPRRGV